MNVIFKVTRVYIHAVCGAMVEGVSLDERLLTRARVVDTCREVEVPDLLNIPMDLIRVTDARTGMVVQLLKANTALSVGDVFRLL